MSSLVIMTGTGIVLTLLALIGVIRLRGPVQVMFALGMLCLAATWFIPVVLSILLQSGMNALPWPANAVVNVVLHSIGGGLLLFAALSRGRGEGAAGARTRAG
ncbi:MAG: hypothetical protein Q4F67_07320 [Propionibacteriaceae bacterium]|nr:hypothetical protein [Propionibacteriaceae bacterium]